MLPQGRAGSDDQYINWDTSAPPADSRDTPEAAGNLDLAVPGVVAVTAVPAEVSGEEHGVDLSGIEEDGGAARSYDR